MSVSDEESNYRATDQAYTGQTVPGWKHLQGSLNEAVSPKQVFLQTWKNIQMVKIMM